MSKQIYSTIHAKIILIIQFSVVEIFSTLYLIRSLSQILLIASQEVKSIEMLNII